MFKRLSSPIKVNFLRHEYHHCQHADQISPDGEVKFAGIAKFIAPDTSKLGYQEIPAGQTVEVTFDVAEM